MGGFFGVVSKVDCVNDVFYGTDYHSHLGTRRAGLANVGDRWCGVDFLSYESTRHKGIHVLGDSIAGAPGMPKSGHMANQEAKVCAGAIAAHTLASWFSM